jgi:hypothetical protein
VRESTDHCGTLLDCCHPPESLVLAGNKVIITVAINGSSSKDRDGRLCCGNPRPSAAP